MPSIKKYIEHSFIVTALVSIIFTAFLFLPLPKEDFSKQSIQSLRVVDRNGIVLREFLNDQQGRGIWKPLSEISPHVATATIAAEDKRFHSHLGVDPIAVCRSLVQNISAFQFKSGGSTITQQVIRNVYHHPRTLFYKILEMWYALRLERMMSKDEILEQYLNRVPYGNQLFGIEAAARWYFEKPARDLSPAEAAFLAALPNAPTILNPRKNEEAATARQRAVLERMLLRHLISQEIFSRAISQPINILPPESHFKAPHAVQMTAEMNPATINGTVTTTIDYPLQEHVQWLIRGHLKELQKKNVHNAAVVIIENSTMEIRALVGSADFFDEKNDGQVNGVTSLRQPGSSVKAFTYALALERGMSPAEILPDIPTAIPDHHGDYVPENYDRKYHGPVRARTALASSYNVPAVRVLQSVGKTALLSKLQQVGFTSIDKDPEFYGYGLTLGNAEVSLLQLTTAYTIFPNKGLLRRATFIKDESVSSPPIYVFDEATSFLITDILKDPVARRPAFGGHFRFPFQCAVKTGTTKDYKDNWTVGYTTRYTVGVWVGNFDGKTMHGVSGVSGAGPIFTDVMNFLHSPPYGIPPEDFEIPKTVERRAVCAQSGKLPTALCKKTIDEWFTKENIPRTQCEVHKLYSVVNEHDEIEQRVFEVFPEEYTQWMRSEKRPLPPPDAVVLTNSHSIDKVLRKLRILSPNNGDYYKIDPVLRSEYQTITVSGFIPKTLSHVVLNINGEKEILLKGSDVPARQSEHVEMQWKLQKGIFRLQLIGYEHDKRIVSNAVFINVE